MKLNEIRDNLGARNKFKRVGRGEGSGVGKTCRRGVKGQKARSGIAVAGFEGGQTPLYMRLPKRGFNNIFRLERAEITLGQLQEAIDSKKLDPKNEIDMDTLKHVGMIRKKTEFVKLLATGEISTAVKLVVSKASKGAIAAIEKAKGSVKETVTE